MSKTKRERVILSFHIPDGKETENMEAYKLCGYSNCFRPYFKHRGFMPCCEFHYKNPAKWGKDGHTYTGSVWRKKEDSINCENSMQKEIK